MQEIKHYDIFTLPNSNTNENIVCVTTNGIIRKDGTAVMGAGIAKTANQRFNLATKLAEHLKKNGNTVCDLGEYTFKTSRFHIVSFPTKQDWKDKSPLWLIERSAKQLIDIGGVVASVLGREFEEGDNIRLMNFLKMQERNGSYFSKAMNRERTENAEKSGEQAG